MRQTKYSKTFCSATTKIKNTFVTQALKDIVPMNFVTTFYLRLQRVKLLCICVQFPGEENTEMSDIGSLVCRNY